MRFLISLIVFWFSSAALADDGAPFITFEDVTQPCNGACSVSVFSGIYSRDGLGLTVATWDDFVNSRWGDGGIAAVSASRRLIGFGHLAQIEGELGLAQRFGNQTSQEVWGAFYLRWMAFPWNDYVKTSFAVSTGLNYAFQDDAEEVARLDNGGDATKLLHYFSPEVTFALPSRPDRELFFRFHHRSGLANVAPTISRELFNNAAAGADYLAVGMRWKF